MVPVLAADARRLDEAQRCRPDSGLHRSRGARTRAHAAIVRAVVVGALDRGLDVAATLEVRGYGSVRQRPASVRAPLSRHDLGFGASAVAVLALVVGARLAGYASFAAYPSLRIPTTATDIVLAVALVLVYLAPHSDRRGISR
jgi:energy-coupling factor transport system permease protein